MNNRELNWYDKILKWGLDNPGIMAGLCLFFGIVGILIEPIQKRYLILISMGVFFLWLQSIKSGVEKYKIRQWLLASISVIAIGYFALASNKEDNTCADLFAGLEEVNLMLDQITYHSAVTDAQIPDACRGPSLSTCSALTSMSPGFHKDISQLSYEREAILSKISKLGCTASASKGRALCGRSKPQTTYTVIGDRKYPNIISLSTGKTPEQEYEEQCEK